MNIERWYSLSVIQQLGNIGSEVARAFAWHAKGDSLHFEQAFNRALELIDMSSADPQWGRRRKELLRIREVFCSYFFGNNEYRLTPEALNKDFLYYGIAARHHNRVVA